MECCEKEKFDFDGFTSQTDETDSHAGKIASGLQEKTYKLFQRKRA